MKLNQSSVLSTTIGILLGIAIFSHDAHATKYASYCPNQCSIESHSCGGVLQCLRWDQSSSKWISISTSEIPPNLMWEKISGWPYNIAIDTTAQRNAEIEKLRHAEQQRQADIQRQINDQRDRVRQYEADFIPKAALEARKAKEAAEAYEALKKKVSDQASEPKERSDFAREMRNSNKKIMDQLGSLDKFGSLDLMNAMNRWGFNSDGNSGDRSDVTKAMEDLCEAVEDCQSGQHTEKVGGMLKNSLSHLTLAAKCAGSNSSECRAQLAQADSALRDAIFAMQSGGSTTNTSFTAGTVSSTTGTTPVTTGTTPTLAALCFPEGTLIGITGSELKPIQEIQTGDLVKSCRMDGDRFTCEYQSVLKVMDRNASHLRVIYYGNNEMLRTTDEHPFYVVNRAEWIPAERLEVGDLLMRDSGDTAVITGLEYQEGLVKVWNLDINVNHNYYAGGVLVHNCTAGSAAALAAGTLGSSVVIPVVAGLGATYLIGKQILNVFNQDCGDSPQSTHGTTEVDSLPIRNVDSAGQEVASKQKLLEQKSTGRTAPSDLKEKLAMEEAMANPGGEQLENVEMGDPRFPAADGWVKMRQTVNKVVIHYLKNTKTGAVADFKFK